MLLQRNCVVKDPYKEEGRIMSLGFPETGSLFEPKKREIFSMRLSKYDNLLEYVVTYYKFSMETLNPDKIKILKAIVWFLDWKNLSLTYPSSNTQTMATIMFKLRNSGINKFALMNFDACFDFLYASATEIDHILDEFNEYYRESYKAEIRAYILANMDGIITLDGIKARFPVAFPGKPFHAELVNEVLYEDYSPNAEEARQMILEKLAVSAYESQVEKDDLFFRQLLIEGLGALGSAGDTLDKIVTKIEHNHELYRNRKKSFIEIIREFIAILFNKKLAADFYECKIMDTAGVRTEMIDHHQFVEELNKKIKTLRSLAPNSMSASKLESIDDTGLFEHLSRQVYDLQRYFRLLTALDEFFKSNTAIQNINRIKGMKPELASIKTALSKAITKKEYYLVNQKLEEQFPL
jgi:hypothetical protein